MVDKLNIYQKLVEVRKGMASFKKDTDGYNFKYVSGTQVLSAIKGDLDKQGIILEQHLTAPEVDGTLVRSPMMMVWVNADDPKDRIEIAWFMVGRQKDPSQSFGSGLTYAERYFMLKFFNVPTDDDDPDKTPSGKGKKGAIKADDLTDPFSGDDDFTDDVGKDERLCTEKQIKRLYAMMKEAGVAVDEWDAMIKKKYSIKHKKEMTMVQIDKVFDSLDKIINQQSA